MGTTKACCNVYNNENRIEAQFKSNESFSYFSLIKDQESKLKKIKQRIAIEKILKQFKKYKANKQLFLSPIHKFNGDSFNINTNCYSDILFSVIKSKNKKISNFLCNNNRVEDSDNCKKEVNIGEMSFYISIKSMPTMNYFQRSYSNILINNKNYKEIYQNEKQKGAIKFMIGDKVYYIGEFYQNYFSGFGLLVNDKMILYEGYWENNVQNGYGIEKWGKDLIYKGEYHNGKKNGVGTFVWPDGSRYEGEWANNFFDGFGIYYFNNNNKIYLGSWKMNLKCGFGIYLTKEAIYIGNYFNDKRNGFGIYYWRKKEHGFAGFWKDGKQHGFGKYMANEKSKYGIWNFESNKNIRIEWFKSREYAYKFLRRNYLDTYIYFFLFNFQQLKDYCNNIIYDEILNISNDFLNNI